MNIKKFNSKYLLNTDSINRYSNNITVYADNGGTGNAFSCVSTPPFAGSYPKLLILTFSPLAGRVPTGPSTITVDSIGTVDLTRQDGGDLQVGDVIGGKKYIALFENSRYSLVGVGISGVSGSVSDASTTISGKVRILTDAEMDNIYSSIDGYSNIFPAHDNLVADSRGIGYILSFIKYVQNESNSSISSINNSLTNDYVTYIALNNSINALDSNKENSINIGNIGEYWRYDKTWSNLETDVLNSVYLTGLNISGGNILDSDNILTAFGKIQNQLNALYGGVLYISTYNASANLPGLSDGVGVKGHYYVVSVAGSQDFGSGIIDFDLGDWVIYNGGIWQKVDNTDSIVTFNGRVGAITLLNTDVITALGYTPAPTATTLAGYNITDAWKLGGNILTTETILGGSSGAFGLDIRTNGLTAIKILSSPANAVNFLTIQSAISGANAKLDSNNGSLDLLTSASTSSGLLRLFSANTQGILQIWDGFSSVYRNTLSANYSGSSGLQFASGWSVIGIGGGNGININISASGSVLKSSAGFNIVSSRSVLAESSGIVVNSGSAEYNAHLITITPNSTNYAPIGTNTSAVNMLKFTAIFNQTVIGSGDITLIDTNNIGVTSNIGIFSILRNNMNSSTNRYGLYFTGTLAHYVNGNVGLGKLPTTAKLAIGGSIDYNVTTLTTTATTDDTMNVIYLTSASPWVLTLHTPTVGRKIILVKRDTTNTITVTGTWSSGYSNLSITNKVTIELIYDGTGWTSNSIDAWKLGGNITNAISSIGSTDNFAVNLISNNQTVAQLQSVTTPTNYIVLKNGDGTTPPIITTSASSLSYLNIGSSNSPSIYTWDNFSNVYRQTLASSNSAGGTLFFAQGWSIINAQGTGRLDLAANGIVRGSGGRLNVIQPNLNFYTASGGDLTSTSATYTCATMWNETNSNFIPTSGNATLTYLRVLGNINQTGSASGEIKTISFEQTLTAHNGLLTLIKSSHNSAVNRYGMYFTGTLAHYVNGNVGLGKLPTTAKLAIGGSIDYNITTLTTTATTDDTMHVITLTSATPWTLTLHNSVIGRTLKLIKKDAISTITVTGTWSAGYSNLLLTSVGVTNLTWDGTGWISY